MPEFLTRRFGPLPAWGWAAVAAGAVVALRWYQSRKASATSATPTSANYTATVPSDFTEPTASVSTPGGFNYSGPLSGLQSLIPTGALSSTNGSTSGDTNPPGVGSLLQPVTAPGPLPSVNAASFPQVVKFGEYNPSDYTQIGNVTGGKYTGQQVSGGVPVYTNIFGGFAQGPFPQTGSYGVYIPSQFTQYEHS